MVAVDVSIAQSADDGWGRYDGSETNTINQDLLLICNSNPASRLLIGLRFICPIPAGAVVDDMVLEFWAYGTSNDDPRCHIAGILEIDPPAWDGSTQPIHQGSYTLTTAQVEWNEALGIPSAQLVQTVDIASVIQELVDQPGYAAGQAISLLMIPFSSPDNLDFRCHGFEHSTNPPPRLLGSYTLPGPAPVGAGVTGDALVIEFDEALDEASVPAGSDFTVKVGGVAQASPTDVDVSGTDVTLTLAAAVAEGDTVTVSYTPGSNPLQADDDGADAAGFTDLAVTNNTVDVSEFPWAYREARRRKLQ